MHGISAGSVKRKAKLLGADLVGIAQADRFKQYPEEKRPEHLLPDAKSVIVVGVRVLPDTVKPNHNGMYGYSACCECMIACPTGR